MTTPDRLTPSVLARLRALPARTRNAILALFRRPDRPPPVVVDPPPVSGEFAPEQFWEHSIYVNAPGDLTVRDCTFGPDWQTKPTTSYSQWGVSGDFSRQTYTAQEWGAWGGSGLAHAVMNLNGPVQAGTIFQDCAWLAGPQPSQMRWGVRGFGIMGVIWERCSFSRGMGAGIQVALRAHEPHGNIAPQGTHRFERLTFAGIGDPKSERWGAFTISEHNPEGYGVSTVPIAVEIIDVRMVGGHVSWTDNNGKAVKSPRGILVQGRSKLVIERLHLDYEAPHDGWAIQVWGVAEVEIRDSFVREGRIELRNCGKVTVTGCTGGAYLAVGTHGNASKPFPMETVTHQGPVTAGYLSPVVK